MPHSNRIAQAIDRLIAEGESVLKSREPHYIDLMSGKDLFKWIAGCRNLMRVLGKHAAAFKTPFIEESGELSVGRGERMMSHMLALREAFESNLLLDITEIVFAEAFVDLIEQAEELASKGYFLAAGVICRAVFEEHLRKLCDVNNCLPGNRPTIEKLKQALVLANVLNKIDAKNVDAIAGEGNYCAHNVQPPLDETAIKGLIQKVQNFLVQHPLR